MQTLDELKIQGVEDFSFISINEVTSLEESAKAIFLETVVQRCIVHLIRISIEYIELIIRTFHYLIIRAKFAG